MYTFQKQGILMLRLFLYLLVALTLTACTPFIGPMQTKEVAFETILPLAQRSQAIYTKDDTQLKTLYPHASKIVLLQDIQMRYMVETFEDLKLQIITLRGTANLENAKQDADYIPSKNPKLGIFVHSGFDNDTMRVYKSIKPYLKQGYDLQITGHSLGASVAALLMIYLHEDGFHLVETANFGQPKFTNAQGVHKYSFLPLLRIVDANDLVPLVPPITLLDSQHGIYEHLAPEVILLDKDYYSYLSKHQSKIISIASFWENLGNISVSAHDIQHYIDNIKSKLIHAVQVPYANREAYISSKGY